MKRCFSQGKPRYFFLGLGGIPRRGWCESLHPTGANRSTFPLLWGEGGANRSTCWCESLHCQRGVGGGARGSPGAGPPDAHLGHPWQSCSARDVPPQMTGVGELFFRRGHHRPVWGVGPMPCRRTLFAALQAFAHSKRPALRHPLLRWPATPALRARAPLPELRVGI